MPTETRQNFYQSEIKSMVEDYIKDHLTVNVSLSTYKEHVDGVTVTTIR